MSQVLSTCHLILTIAWEIHSNISEKEENTTLKAHDLIKRKKKKVTQIVSAVIRRLTVEAIIWVYYREKINLKFKANLLY